MDYFNGIRSNTINSIASGLLGQIGNVVRSVQGGDLSALSSYVKSINSYDIPGAPEHARAARQKAYADLHDALVASGYVPRHAARLIEMAGGGALGSMGFGSGEMRDIPNVGNHYRVGDLRREHEARWGMDPFQQGERAQRQMSEAAARNEFLPKAPYAPAPMQPREPFVGPMQPREPFVGPMQPREPFVGPMQPPPTPSPELTPEKSAMMQWLEKYFARRI